ncbi:MAG: bifunctional tetrahydrofolate synthase/dihydrofolate synthase [Gammaproteobacteria bacterium]
MRFSSLNQWLRWQETLHPEAIELGLGRLAAVARPLGLHTVAHGIVTVAGTNGKGSSVALIEAMLRSAGYRVGAYTSPHLSRYNERVRVDGVEASDQALCEAFAAVDAVRRDTTLSYFEFGTLAAMDIFRRERVDIAVLEVGLGGRLDAVNLWDADVAMVTGVDIDHVEWLGSDREAIGREKAGVFRPGHPAICAEREPPASLRAYAERIAARWMGVGEHFDFLAGEQGWTWWNRDTRWEQLPLPALAGDYQLANAAGAVAVTRALGKGYTVSRDAVANGLRTAVLPARLQVVPGEVERVLDVGHNPQAARALAGVLAQRPCQGRTLAVFGMLADKDVEGVVGAMGTLVDHWYLGGLEGPRGLNVRTLQERAVAVLSGTPCHADASVAQAYRRACADAQAGDRVVVFGSFHTVAEVLEQGL